jgi:hypothetical protein
VESSVSKHRRNEPQHADPETTPKDLTPELVILPADTIEPSQPEEEASSAHYGLDSRNLAQISIVGFFVPLETHRAWEHYRVALEACEGIM